MASLFSLKEKRELNNIESKVKILHENIRLCSKRKKELEAKVREFKRRHERKEISYSEYEYLINNYLKGKSLSHWNSYYSNYKKEALMQLKGLEKDNVTELKQKEGGMNYLNVIFIFSVFIVGFFFMQNYTGLFFLSQEEQATLMEISSSPISLSEKEFMLQNKFPEFDIKVDAQKIQISKDGMTMEIKGGEIYELNEVVYEKGVVYVNDMDIKSATIKVPGKQKPGIISPPKVLTCKDEDFDKESFKCSHWENSGKLASVKGSFYTFNVDHFSAYYVNSTADANYTTIGACLAAINNTVGQCIINGENFYAVTPGPTFYNITPPTDEAHGVLELQANNITLDCNGTMIRSPLNVGYGIWLLNAYNNITISNCSLSNFSTAIRYNAGSNNTKIINNNLTKTENCLVLTGTNANLSNNYCNATEYGISIGGNNNFIGHNTIYAGSGDSGTGISIGSLSSSFIVDNNTIFAGEVGIVLTYTNKAIVSNNNIIAVEYGILLDGGSYFNNITRNIISTSGSQYSSADLAMAEDDEMPSNNSIWLNHFYGLGVLGLDGSSNPISPSNDMFCILISSNFSTTIHSQGNATNSTAGNTTFFGVPTFYPASHAIDGQWGTLSTAWSSTPDDTIDQWLKVDLSSVANSNISRVIILWQNGSRSHNRSLEYSLNGNSWTILSVRNTTNISVDSLYCESCVPDVVDNININAPYWRVFQEGGKGRSENYTLVIYEFMIFNQTKTEVYEGNFYNAAVNSSFLGPNDCGPVNISIPQSNNTYAVAINVTWKKQSSIKPIEYTLEYSIDNGASWTEIATVTDTNYLWDILEIGTTGATNVSLSLTPSDLAYSATISIISNFNISDFVSPVVTLIEPESGYNQSGGTVEFQFDLTENNPGVCELWGNWTKYRNHTVVGGALKSFDVEAVLAVDFNEDGYTDVVTGSAGGVFANQYLSNLGLPALSVTGSGTSKIAWYEYDPLLGSTGGAFGAPYVEHIIKQDYELNGTFKLKVADINNDGYKDIVYWTALQGLGWLKNSGDNLTFLNFTLTEAEPRQKLPFSFGDIEVADLNNDGYLDIISGNTSNYYYLLNNGSAQPGFAYHSFLKTSDLKLSFLADSEAVDFDLANGTDIIGAVYAQCDFCGEGFWAGICYYYCASFGANGQLVFFQNNGSNPPGFIKHNLIKNNSISSGITSIKVTDFDRDGDNDVVWCALSATYNPEDSSNFCFVGWAENNGSIENLPYHAVGWGNESCYVCLDIETTDINMDGYEDVIVSKFLSADFSQSYLVQGGVSWFSNNGSNDNFTKYDIVNPSQASYGPVGIDIENFTYYKEGALYQDNKTDVLVSSMAGIGLAWFENQGEGGRDYDSSTFPANARIEVAVGTQDAKLPTYVKVIDFDRDGYKDVFLVNALGRSVAWWENDGLYSFTKHTIVERTTSSDIPAFAKVADFDGDSDYDVLLTAGDIMGLLTGQGVGTSGSVSWFENSGDDLTFTEHMITSGDTVGVPVGSGYADVDGDNDTDFFAALSMTDEVAWWEDTNGSGTSFTKHTIANCTGADGPEDVTVIDFDFDGDYDVVFTSAGPFNKNPQLGRDYVSCTDPALNETFNCVDYECGDRVAWWENKKETYNDSLHWEEHIIGNGSTKLNGAFGLRVVDFDNDGDYDAVTTSIHIKPTKVYWWENDGTNNYFTPHLVDGTSGDTAIQFETLDYDRDGDFDVVIGSGIKDSLLWFENLGNGTSFVKNTIYKGTGGALGTDAILFPDVADMDDDNDYDLVFAEIIQSKVYWYENDKSFGERQRLTSPDYLEEGTNIFTETNISEGRYIWNVVCNDTSQNSKSSSSNWSLTIDPGVPRIVFTNISNGTSIINATLPTNIGETVTFNLNITEPTTIIEGAWLEIYQNESETSPLLFKENLNKITSRVFSVNAPINASYSTRRYNYTIFSNDTLDNRNSYSGILKVGNTAPQKPNLEYPVHGNFTETNRTLTFSWNCTDQDGDSLTYTLRIWCLKDSVPCLGENRSDNRNVTGIKNTYYSLTYDLKSLYDDGYAYNWTVEVTDGIATNMSNVSEFGIRSLVSLGLVSTEVNLGTLSTGTKINTTNSTPLQLRNDGNVILDVNLSATPLFSLGGFPSSTYQYKIAEHTSYSSSFNLTQSITNWTNMPLANTSSVRWLNYSHRQDLALVHLLLDIPFAEPAGVKVSNVTFTGWRAV